jgi:hypothetical protein
MRRSWPLIAVATLAFACGGSVGGGGAGGDAGAGGAGGSGASGGSGGASTEELIDLYCARIAALPCGQPEPDCRVQGRQAHSEAVDDGCAAEFDAVVRCATTEVLSCTRPADDACAGEIDRLEACTPSGGECTMGIGNGPLGVTCSVACADYAAECSMMSGADTAQCTCTAGTGTGRTYVASTCESGVDSAEGLCL